VKSPIRQVLLYQKVRVLLGIGALAISTAINYLILYMATYAWLGAFPPIGDLAPGYYLTLIGIISLFALIVIRRTTADAV